MERHVAQQGLGKSGPVPSHGEITEVQGSTIAQENGKTTPSMVVSNVEESAVGTESPSPALNINVVHQRRRVNPESLALRLGPDLVRDLDALILPGNTEMPSFAVRKELQERYNIDRRHIYDYFHSRGLRVVKEDKHGNPVLPKDPGPTLLPNLRPLRQAPLKNPPRSHPPYSITTDAKWNVSKPRGVTKAKPGRPRKKPVGNPKVTPNTVCETANSAAPDHPPSPPIVPSYLAVNPLIQHIPPPVISGDDGHATFNSVINPLDESFSLTRAIGDIAYSYRYKVLFDRMFELGAHSVSVPSDQPISSSETSPCSASGNGFLLPHVKSLSSNERQAIYHSLSESLGPSCGIQECEGTYRKHMEDRSRLYYQGLLSVPHHHSHPSDGSRAATALDRKPTLGTNEFRFWLSSTDLIRRDGIHSSPRRKHDPRTTVSNVARQQAVKSYDKRCHGDRSDRLFGQSLDDLFPPSLQDFDFNVTGNSTESPVVHTPFPPYIAPQFFALREDVSREHGNLGDDALFSDMLQSSPPAPPARSVAELPEGRTEIHGLADFPGSLEVMMPAVEMEGPPRSEHFQRPQYSVSLWFEGTGLPTTQESDAKRSTRKGQASARARFAPYSPYKSQLRESDRVRTRSITSRGSRRRTTSAAGGI